MAACVRNVDARSVPWARGSPAARTVVNSPASGAPTSGPPGSSVVVKVWPQVAVVGSEPRVQGICAWPPPASAMLTTSDGWVACAAPARKSV